MAVLPNLDPLKPIKTPGLFDAAAAGGMTYEQWQAANPTGNMPSIAPSQVNDSMAAQVAALTAQDSKLNQMAKTEGLKAANRRGLLNSSMAVGASQDALLKNVLPIAAQDAAQLYGKNQAARAFEYGMTGQDDTQQFESAEAKAVRDWQTSEALAGRNWQTGERLGTQEFQSAESLAERGWQSAENLLQRGFLTSEAELGRELEKFLQAGQIDEAQRAQLAAITSAEYMQEKGLTMEQALQEASNQLQRDLQENDITFRMQEGQLTREAAEAAQRLDIEFQRSEGALDRKQELQMLDRDIAFRASEGKLTRAAAAAAQDKDIAARMKEGNLSRASAERMLAAEIKANGQIAALDRTLQQKIASWNLSASNKQNVAQDMIGVEQTYANKFATIMNNPDISAAARTAQLKAIKDNRALGLRYIENIYSTDFTF